jgi:protein-S-isoprenylcysteine O-methyltransferase Ste14
MVRIPPPIWLLLIEIAAGVASVLYPWRMVFDARVVPLGIALVVAGVAVSVWAWGLFRAAGTEIMPNSATNKTLIIEGPYRFTRNPMYLGLLLLSLGIAFWAGTLPFFAAPILIFAICNLAHIPFEEAKMRRQFGEQFDAYTRKVRRWI